MSSLWNISHVLRSNDVWANKHIRDLEPIDITFSFREWKFHVKPWLGDNTASIVYYSGVFEEHYNPPDFREATFMYQIWFEDDSEKLKFILRWK